MLQNDLKTDGTQLGGRLAVSALEAPLVLALNSNSLPVARDVAIWLGGELDRIFVEGMDVPSESGRYTGAVSETGHLALEHAPGGATGGSEEAFALDILNHILRLVERRVATAPGTGIAASSGRNVILVADGLAGGATMVAAIRGVRSRQPLRLVAAIGCAPSRTIDRIRKEADETVTLSTVANIGNVGRVRRALRLVKPVTDR